MVSLEEFVTKSGSMLKRTRCPITDSEQLETLLDVPFDSGVWGEWTAERRWLNRLAKLRFAILYNESIDLYFQRWVLSKDAVHSKKIERLRQGRYTLAQFKENFRELALSAGLRQFPRAIANLLLRHDRVSFRAPD
jgi:hypothetical protein